MYLLNLICDDNRLKFENELRRHCAFSSISPNQALVLSTRVALEKLIDMEKNGQYSKLISDIPEPDIAISMGCNVECPFIGRPFDDNWGLEDPTGKSDEEFIKVIRQIETNIHELEKSLG